MTDQTRPLPDLDAVYDYSAPITGCRACNEDSTLCREHAADALGSAGLDLDRLAEIRADLLAALAADDAYEADEDSDPGDYRTRVARQRAAEVYYRAIVAAAVVVADGRHPDMLDEFERGRIDFDGDDYQRDPLELVRAIVAAWDENNEPEPDRIMRPRPGYAYDDSDTATLPDGSDPEGPQTCNNCHRIAEPFGVLCRVCIAAAVALDPTDEVGIAELVAGLAPAPLTGPGFIPTGAGYAAAWPEIEPRALHNHALDLRQLDGSAWSQLLTFSAQHRRALLAERGVSIAHAASLIDAAAGLSPTDDPDDIARMHELADVWGSLLARFDHEHSIRTGTVRRDFYAWRGDLLAQYDGSAERFELSPSGRWAGAWPWAYVMGERIRLGIR